jgi:hypothetical protein
MSGPNPTWLRRHRRRAVIGLCVAAVGTVGVVKLLDAVQRVRDAAGRSADL